MKPITTKIEEGGRIEILDGFRAIAILAVVLYHFYYLNNEHFPNIKYKVIDYSPYAYITASGFYGVEFFFIISGFVIFFSLEKSKSVYWFLYKRFIRLFPSILLCAIITYFVVKLIDQEHEFIKFQSLTPLNFIPSFTFSSPALWNSMLMRNDIDYVSKCYWSLTVEVSFYIVASILFFSSKKNFFSNWIKLAVVVFVVNKLLAIIPISEDNKVF